MIYMIFLAVDITAIIISAIGAIVSLGTVYLTLIIKKNVDSYKKEVDGMKTELIAATKGQYQAEGELKGKADQKAEQKADAVPPVPAAPIDVNIVDQSKPVDVTQIKK